MRKWSMSVASVLCVLSATAAAGQSRPPTVDELVPRIEADPVRRFPMVSVELFGRIFERGERAADLGERLLALAR